MDAFERRERLAAQETRRRFGFEGETAQLHAIYHALPDEPTIHVEETDYEPAGSYRPLTNDLGIVDEGDGFRLILGPEVTLFDSDDRLAIAYELIAPYGVLRSIGWDRWLRPAGDGWEILATEEVV